MIKLKIKPIHEYFAAEIEGLDLKKPIDDAEVLAFNAAIGKYAVLVFKKQSLTYQQQIAFTENFGDLDVGLKRVFKRPGRLEDDRLLDISNLDEGGNISSRDSPKTLSSLANQLWHSDSSFMKPRAAYSMLQCIHLPSWGGDTQFVDLRHAYDTLDDRTRKEIEFLEAEHVALHTRLLLGDNAYTDNQKLEIPPAVWPLTDTHKESGRKFLFVGAHAARIIGWSVPEGRLFLNDLLEHATQPSSIYTHKWELGDFVVWDNRITLHRGRRYDLSERRELRRTTINDTPGAKLQTH